MSNKVNTSTCQLFFMAGAFCHCFLDQEISSTYTRLMAGDQTTSTRICSIATTVSLEMPLDDGEDHW